MITLAIWIRKLGTTHANEHVQEVDVMAPRIGIATRQMLPPAPQTPTSSSANGSPICPEIPTYVAFTTRWSLLQRRLRLAVPLALVTVLAEVLSYILVLLPTEATSNGSGGADYVAHMAGLAGGALMTCSLHPLLRDERRYLDAAHAPLEYATRGKSTRVRVCCQYACLYARLLLFVTACGFAFVFGVALPSACC